MENADDNMGLRVASFAYYLDAAKDNYKAKSNSKPPLNVSRFSRSKDSQDGLASLRVDSFSYRSASENFVFKVPGPVQDPTASFSFSQQEIPKDGEISVFGADRYFNMKLEHQAGVLKHEFKNKGMTDIPFIGPNARLRTPSLCSEESSWNSQTAVFPSLPRIEPQTKQKKTFGRRIFAGFGCPGPCFHRKLDVCINEMVADGTAYYGSKPTRTGSERVDTLAFIQPPNLVTKDTLAVKKQLQILDEARNSIEVFESGSAASLKGDVATNMERKLSMLTWDAFPKGTQNHQTSTVGHSTFCDDMASDASSDLFEIENISGSMFLPLTTDQATDDQMSSCTSPTSHYAPSEASIQWSVVTASAADFSSVLWFNEEQGVDVAKDVIAKNIASSRSSKTTGMEVKEGPKTRPSGGGGILRCKNYKAVEVAENARLQVPNQDFHSARREKFYKELHV